MSIRRMVSELPTLRLPPGITRYRINLKRDDGTWEHGEWITGPPPQPATGLRGNLLEYDMRTLTPPKLTILGDTTRTWNTDIYNPEENQ
jgi:hypothetical protein